MFVRRKNNKADVPAHHFVLNVAFTFFITEDRPFSLALW